MDPPTTPALIDIGPEMFIAVVTSVSFSTNRAEYETIFPVSLTSQRFEVAYLTDIGSRTALGWLRRGQALSINFLWNIVEDRIVHAYLLREAVEAVSGSDRTFPQRETYP